MRRPAAVAQSMKVTGQDDAAEWLARRESAITAITKAKELSAQAADKQQAEDGREPTRIERHHPVHGRKRHGQTKSTSPGR